MTDDAHQKLVAVQSLSANQRRFLPLFLTAETDRLRDAWLDAAGKSLGGVVDHRAPPSGAVRLKVWRLTGATGRDFTGALEAKRHLAVGDLPALEGLWLIPLRSLNERGRALAEAARAPALVQSLRMQGRDQPVTWRQPPVAFAALKVHAQREGRTMTAVLNDALAAYLERHA